MSELSVQLFKGQTNEMVSCYLHYYPHDRQMQSFPWYWGRPSVNIVTS